MLHWRANQLIRWTQDHRIERLLWVDVVGDLAYLIEVESNKALPHFVRISELNIAMDVGGLTIEPDDPVIRLPLEESLTQKEREKRDNAWSLIQPLLKAQPGIFSRRQRGSLVADVMERNGVTKQSVYRYLRRFWQRGMIPNALLPDYCNSGAPGREKASTSNKRGRPRKYSDLKGINIDDEVRSQIKSIVNLHYANNRLLDLHSAYNELIGRYYSVSEVSSVTGQQEVVELKSRPTFAQFRYWFEKDSDKLDIERMRRTPRVYDKDCRGLTGTSTQEVVGPGSRYQIDATILDLYIVSRYDRSKIVGRPVLYVVIDIFSRMIVGISVGLEGPSWVGAMMALANVVQDKVEYCRQFDIHIDPEQWPYAGLSSRLLSDRGETAGESVHTLIEKFDVKLETTGPYRADWKGIVERRFRLLQRPFAPYVPGYIQSDYQERGGSDYRLDATLDIDHITGIVIRSVIYYNTKHIVKNYHRDPDMVEDGLTTIPINLWEWGIQRRNGQFLHFPFERVKLALLPTDSATVTESGILFYGCYYTCDEAINQRWFDRARMTATWKVTISYDPRLMDAIYIHDTNGTYIQCELMSRSDNFRSQSLREIDQVRFLNRQLNANVENNELMGKINLTDEIERIVETAKAMKSALSSIHESKRSRLSSIRKNRTEEQRSLRSRDAFRNLTGVNKAELVVIPSAISESEDELEIPEVNATIRGRKRDENR